MNAGPQRWRPQTSALVRGMALVLLAGACQDLPLPVPPFLQKQPGHFHVHFVWGDTPRPDADGQLFIRAQVLNGETLVSSAGPVAYQPAARLEFTNVPNQDNLWVAAQFRDGASSEAVLVYYGYSQTFSMAPGVDEDVEVRVGLRAAPGAAGEQLAVAPGVTLPRNATTVDLAVSAGPGLRLRLSNTAAPVAGNVAAEPRCADDATAPACVVDLDEASALMDGRVVVPGWDLARGATVACGTCTVTVYGRLVDSEGVESEALSLDVPVDMQAPQVTLSLSRTVATAGDVVVLTALADELVQWPQTALVWTGNGSMVTAVLELDSITVHSWRVVVDADTPEGTLTLDATSLPVTDLAGNPATLVGATAFSVDKTIPVLSIVDFEPRRLNAMTASQPVVVTYTLTQDPAETDPSALVAVEVRDVAGTCLPAAPDGVGGSCVVMPPPGLGSQSGFGFKLVAWDEAGNLAVVTAEVEVDVAPPSILLAQGFFEPGPNNPLANVQALKDGTTYTLFVVPSEPVLDDQAGPVADQIVLEVVPAVGPPVPLTLKRLSDPPPILHVLEFSLVGTQGMPTGEHVLRLSMVDQARNPAVHTSPANGPPLATQLPRLSVRAEAPTLTTAPVLTHFRAPTGRPIETGEDPILVDGGVSPRPPGTYPLARGDPLAIVGLRGPLGSAPGMMVLEAADRPLLRVRMWEWADPAAPGGVVDPLTMRLLADAPLTGGAADPVSVTGEYVSGVLYTVVDDAGNESLLQAVETSDVRLQHRAPRSGPPAHALVSSPHLRDTEPPVPPELAVEDQALSAHPSISKLDNVNVDVVASTALEQVLFQARPAPALGDASVVQWNPLRGQALFMSSDRGDGSGAAVRQWDGRTWYAPSNGVLVEFPTQGASAAFDPRWGMLWVSVGTDTGRTTMAGWDGTSWSVREVLGGPADTRFMASTYDPVSGLTVWAGGKRGMAAAVQSAVWGFDGEAFTVLPALPQPLWGASAMYDGGFHRVVVVGGCTASGVGSGSAPVMSLTAAGWQVHTASGASPPAARCQASLTPLPTGALYGGGSNADAFVYRLVLGSTSAAWTRLPGAMPLDATNVQLVADPAGRVWAMGRSGAAETTTRVFERVGAEWLDRSPPLATISELQSGCAVPALATAPGVQPLLVDGVNAANADATGTLTPEVRAWDGENWRPLGVIGGVPRSDAACARVPAGFAGLAGTVLLHGGDVLGVPSPVVSVLDPDASSPAWTAVGSVVPLPALSHHAMIYDPTSMPPALLVVGGVDATRSTNRLSCTSTDALTWACVSNAALTAAGALDDVALVHHDGLGKVYMLGGDNTFSGDGQVLEYDRGAWSAVAQSGLPALGWARAAYVPGLDALVVVGSVQGLSTLPPGGANSAGSNLVAGIYRPEARTWTDLAWGPTRQPEVMRGRPGGIWADPANTGVVFAAPGAAPGSGWVTWLRQDDLPHRPSLQSVFSLTSVSPQEAQLTDARLLIPASTTSAEVYAFAVTGSLPASAVWTGPRTPVAIGGMNQWMAVDLDGPAASMAQATGGAVAVQVRGPAVTAPGQTQRVVLDSMELLLRYCRAADQSGTCP